MSSGTPLGAWRVLILGGTAEARHLAAELQSRPGVCPISSLAGRVTDPRLPVGEVRIGGFGGVDGLARWLAHERIDAVIDATHPYASRIRAASFHAAEATGLPHLRLERPGWTAQTGDRWLRVPDLEAAAAALPGLGRRVFLTTGRQRLDAFTHLSDLWLLARVVDEPTEPLPSNVGIVRDRGPYTVDGEVGLLTTHHIEVVVTKDSGGEYTAAKLIAARQLGLTVVMVDRPPTTGAPATVPTVADALSWVDGVMPPGHAG
jgi:precorrin-6A/cobalt-precorrin-6A reductase